MKNLVLSILFFVSSQAFGVNEYNLTKTGLILEGYDTVSYFQGAPQKGSVKFQTKIGDVTYLFASEDNKITFLKDPKKYEPAFGGWCAYAVADSNSKVEVDPKSFVIQDGRLLVFYNGFFGDTRKKWTTTKGKSSAVFLTEADKNWINLKSKAP